MVAGAAASFSVLPMAFFAYSVPALTPIIVRFGLLGDELHLAMAGMVLLFGLMMVFIAMRVKALTVASLKLRCENRDLVLVGREIIELKRVKKVLQESEERFRQIAENIQEVFWMSDLDFTKMFYVSPAYEEIWGRKTAELYNNPKSWMDAIHPEDRERVEETLRLRGMDGFAVEYRIVSPDGFVRWIWNRAFPVRNEGGEVYRIAGIAEDITERKRAEEALQEREEKFRFITENIHDLVAQTSTGGRYVYVSPSYKKTLGYDAASLLGKSGNDYVHPEDLERFVQSIQKAVAQGDEELKLEYRLRHQSGEYRWFEGAVKFLFDEGGKFSKLQVNSRDITDRKEMEEALRKSEEEARRLPDEKAVMAEIGRIISSTFDIERVYELFSKEVRRIVPFDRITINIIDYQKNTFTILYTSGLNMPGRKKGTTLSLAGDPTGEVIRTKCPLHIQEDEETHRRFPSLLPVFLAGFRSFIFIPMISQDKVIGVLGLLSTQPKAYTEKELRVAERVGNQIGGAIANAQLFNTLKDTEHAFRQSELFLRNVLEALPISVSITDKNGKVLLNNPARNKIWAGGEFEGISQLGKYKGWWADTGKKVEEDEWGLARAVKEGKTSLNRMMNIETFDGQEKTILNSAVPIRDKSGEIIGAISVNQDITELKGVESQVKKLLQSVSQKQKELRALGARLAEVGEEERRRLVRELHDRVGQNLTALGINLNILRANLPADAAAKMSKFVEDSLRLVTETVGDIRNLMAELRPPVLDEYGLLAALRWYGEQFSQRTGLNTVVQGDETMPRLPSETEIALFRIAQEALTNVAKHARASRGAVTLRRAGERTVLTIADNGVGFAPQASQASGAGSKWGILIIHERVEAIGGHVRIESEPGKGTRIIVELRK
jgi:PAS domain S-box-containing protein